MDRIGMRLGAWLGRTFGSVNADDDAVEREEYGLPDAGAGQLQRDPLLAFGGGDATDLNDADLEALTGPSDSAG